MNRQTFLLLFCTLFITGNSFGQEVNETTSAYALWELSDPATEGSGLTVLTSGPIDAVDQQFVGMRVNSYTGAKNSQRSDNRPPGGATQWPENQTDIIESVYTQFAVSAMSGTDLTIKNTSLKIGADYTNYLKARILYSQDPDFNTFEEIPASLVLESNGYILRADSLHTVSLNLNVQIPGDRTFYLRVYPWVHNQTSGLTGKYLLLKDVKISGTVEGEIEYDLASLSTEDATFVSTTYCTCGGDIESDGGAQITQRGVVWNTTGSPTIENNHTSDGTGSGAFTSHLTGLTPGTEYFAKAYAINAAGTAYGEEITFKTLDSLDVPWVFTAGVSNVRVETAECGGSVIDWGGAEITAKGLVWNTTGSPTLDDSYNIEGDGMSAFNSLIYPLQETTTYYVCAYATNSAGTGYGSVREFTTLAPQPDVYKVVDHSGNGDYTTVQQAFDNIPDKYTGNYYIYIKNGVYYEKLLLDREKLNVTLRGENADSTILTFDDYAGKAGGTSNSYSTAIDADDFTAVNITFQNTVMNDGSFEDQQAVALRVNGDRQSYYNCRLLGYQDTYYTWGGRGTGRTYMKNCYIEGSVDFIFGRNIVLFDSCEIHINRNGGALTAAATEADSKFGYVFKDCIISNDNIGFDGKEIYTFVLGRPWQGAPRTVFINTQEPAALSLVGWSAWNVPPALYAEYNCYGEGADTTYRTPISRQLSDEEAAEYTLENIFAKTSNPRFSYDWVPEEPPVYTRIDSREKDTAIPTRFRLEQNYPNPFNPTTTINYAVPYKSNVKLTLYNVLGEKVRELVNEQKGAGVYTYMMNAEDLSSGIYFYKLETGNCIKIRKALFVK